MKIRKLTNLYKSWGEGGDIGLIQMKFSEWVKVMMII